MRPLIFFGLAGIVLVPAIAAARTIVGTPGNDTLVGGPGRDVLVGLAGDDELFGGRGSDVLRGGDGHDRLFGGDDDDLLTDGGQGTRFWDQLRGGGGDDRLIGGPGADVLRGDSGDDILDARDGRQRALAAGLDPPRSGDYVLGEDGNDLILTRDGRVDVFSCDDGRDRAIVDRIDQGGAGCEMMRQSSARVSLVALAPKRLRLCRRARLLRPACPALVPRVRAAYLAHLSRELAPGHPFVVFDLERGGEDRRRPDRNRPPRMAHLVVAAGEVWRAAPIWSLGTRRARLRDALMPMRRPHTLAFGRVRWDGRVGTLWLAPGYPRGGMLGNHLVFRWRQRRTEYFVSLHAWEPLTEAAATLQRIVAASGRV